MVEQAPFLWESTVDGGPILRTAYLRILPGDGTLTCRKRTHVKVSPVLSRRSLICTTVSGSPVGGLVFKAHRRLYHLTLDLREIKKKKKRIVRLSPGGQRSGEGWLNNLVSRC